ncbi:hypothetical protein Aduo_017110 [Ancylostoma duodenale]
MCVYETMKPCDFKERLDKAPMNYRITRYAERGCYAAKERVICYCYTNLCNGDLKIFLRNWVNSNIGNKTLFNCVRKHIESRSWKNTTPPQELTKLPPNHGVTKTTREGLEPVTDSHEGNKQQKGAKGSHRLRRQSDYEPFDRSSGDVLMFTIIAVGAAILACLVVPSVVYVVKSTKTGRKNKRTAGANKPQKSDSTVSKTSKTKGKSIWKSLGKSSTGKSPGKPKMGKSTWKSPAGKSAGKSFMGKSTRKASMGKSIGKSKKKK